MFNRKLSVITVFRFHFLPEWRILDSQNKMVHMDMKSIIIPERFQHHIHRDAHQHLLRQMQAKLAVMTKAGFQINALTQPLTGEFHKGTDDGLVCHQASLNLKTI